MRQLALAAVLVLALVAFTGNAFAGTDPGARDSVWIEDVVWDGDSSFATTLYTTTDSELKHATVVLRWTSTDIAIDSVSLVGSRWLEQVDGDSGVFVATQGLIGGAPSPIHYDLSFLPFGSLLPVGTGPACTIYWRRAGGLNIETTYTVDSSTTTSGGTAENSTLFGTSALPEDNFVPGFGAAVITVVGCSCPHQSDFDTDGFLTSLDLGMMIDILFAGATEPFDPSCASGRADFDCDGFPTSLDLGQLIDHLFAGADGPCDPCAP